MGSVASRGSLFVMLRILAIGILGSIIAGCDGSSPNNVQATSKPVRPTARTIRSTATPIAPTKSKMPPTSSIFAITRFTSPIRKYTHGEVNLRQGPGTEYVAVGSVAGDTALDVIGEVGEWYETMLDRGTAYVAGWLLFDDPLSQAAQERPTLAPRTGATDVPQAASRHAIDRFSAPMRKYTHGQVNLRKGPGTSFDLVGYVAAGSTLDLVGQSGEWYVIRHNGGEVYIAGWLTFDAPLAQPVQQQPAAVQQPPVSVVQQPPANVARPPPANVGQAPAQIGSCRPGPNNVPGVRYSGSCKELRSQGICGFPKGDQNYSLRRDGDRDDCGCDCQ